MRRRFHNHTGLALRGRPRPPGARTHAELTAAARRISPYHQPTRQYYTKPR